MIALIQSSGFNVSMAALEGSEWENSGLIVRNFFIGDHMVQYKVTGADSPSSSLDWRQSCPWCSLSPDMVCDWKSVPSQLEEIPRPNAPVKLPRSQFIPDCMHGCHNMLHGILLPCLETILSAKGLAHTEILAITRRGLSPDKQAYLPFSSIYKLIRWYIDFSSYGTGFSGGT